MRLFKFILPVFAVAVFAPVKVMACAACYGARIDDRMADGMNWAILTLGLVIASVLGVFGTFLIYVIRKSEAMEASQAGGRAAAGPRSTAQPQAAAVSAAAPQPAKI